MDLDAPEPTKRLPQDAFERELFRQTIERALQWEHIGYVYMAEEPNEQGEWTIDLARTDDEAKAASQSGGEATINVWEVWNRRLNEQYVWALHGTAWLAEREYPASEHYRVVVCWSFPAQAGLPREQSNYAPYPPVVQWPALSDPAE